MSLVEFKCETCGRQEYAFKEEPDRYPSVGSSWFGPKISGPYNHFHKWEMMPPFVSIVHSTEIFMLSQLDSVYTIHELDAKLQLEASDERELRQQNLGRKEL